MVKSNTCRSLKLVAPLALFMLAITPVRAEIADPATLAAALRGTSVTLQDGLKASEREGKPISAKFEIEDGKLQLSVYTIKGDGFSEVVVDPKTGTIGKAEKITDADDLKAAVSQKAAMAKATTSLAAATDKAVAANNGFRAVSVIPQLEGGRSSAEVTLLQGTTVKSVNEKLY